jgi:RNA polymerase sigma-70 factor (ECF subfamily)
VTETPESALIERGRRGDRQALGGLLNRYQGPVFNAALRIVGNPDDASDVTQSVFLKAFENLDRYDPAYRFFSWIYRIAVNESINHNKRRYRMHPLDERDIPDNHGPLVSTETVSLNRQIQEGLMELDEIYRVVVVLRHYSDFSYREIGEILDIPEKTVKSRLFTARRQMRDILLARGVEV